MASAKKRKPASGLKSSRKRAQKRATGVSTRSAVNPAKKPGPVRSTKSRSAVTELVTVKATGSKSTIVRTAVAKPAANLRPGVPATGGSSDDKSNNGKRTGSAATNNRPARTGLASTVPLAPDKSPRTPEPQATKWSGDVIRVPPLRKGQKSKANRTKSSSRANGGGSPSDHDPIQFPEQDQALPRTPLTDAQLREFKALLLLKRAELCGDVVRLTDEALNRGSDGPGDQSSMPIHMADLGTDNWEQEFTLGLIANEQAVVREIDQALERIAAKTYGVCLATHAPIGLARLRAKPWAKYCIEYARAREEGRAN